MKYLTPEGLEKLKKELEHLESVKRREIGERLKNAAAQGDLKENAGYDAAKEEQGFIEGRIKELKKTIAQAQIIAKKEANEIQVGSLVFLDSGEKEEKFQIVGQDESDILQNKISFDSPLAQALLGKKKGEKIEISTPEGKKQYKIIKIE